MPLETEHDLLLEAAIIHLESLKRQGIRFIKADRKLLQEVVATRATAAPSPTPPHQALSLPTDVPTSPRPASPLPAIAIRPARTDGRPPARTSAPQPPPTPAASEKTSASILTPDEKEKAFAAVRDRASTCVLCPHLVASRRNVVFGVGNIHAQLMFVGEAPGAEEDVQGEPFVGAAGQLLTKVIQAMGLNRTEVYIGNVLKCRPDTPEQAYGNRKPTPEEMGTCLPYLQEQIRIIQPQVIVALGGTAMEGLFGKAPIYITKLRGKWQDFNGIPVMPTYHPSYVLRNQSPVTKRETWEDMLAVMERLQMPISDKQRGYFLKAG